MVALPSSAMTSVDDSSVSIGTTSVPFALMMTEASLIGPTMYCGSLPKMSESSTEMSSSDSLTSSTNAVTVKLAVVRPAGNRNVSATSS